MATATKGANKANNAQQGGSQENPMKNIRIEKLVLNISVG
jgi:ribosomal protein L5